MFLGTGQPCTSPGEKDLSLSTQCCCVDLCDYFLAGVLGVRPEAHEKLLFSKPARKTRYSRGTDASNAAAPFKIPNALYLHMVSIILFRLHIICLGLYTKATVGMGKEPKIAAPYSSCFKIVCFLAKCANMKKPMA